jgi:hypothetical protein
MQGFLRKTIQWINRFVDIPSSVTHMLILSSYGKYMKLIELLSFIDKSYETS